MNYSPENPTGDVSNQPSEINEQFDFFDGLDALKEPIKKFPLRFGEEALFDSREPNMLEIYGNAQATAASIHFDSKGKILDISVRGPYTNEAQAREIFRSKAEGILKKHKADLGLE